MFIEIFALSKNKPCFFKQLNFNNRLHLTTATSISIFLNFYLFFDNLQSVIYNKNK